MSICGHLNPAASPDVVFSRPCIREPGHPFSHRDRYGLTWVSLAHTDPTPFPMSPDLMVCRGGVCQSCSTPYTHHPRLPLSTSTSPPPEPMSERLLQCVRAALSEELKLLRAVEANVSAYQGVLDRATKPPDPKGAPNPT